MANTSITTTATTRGGGEGGGRNKGKETKQQQSSNSTATGAGAQMTMTAVRKFNGYFRLVSQRDYDDYLKIIGRYNNNHLTIVCFMLSCSSFIRIETKRETIVNYCARIELGSFERFLLKSASSSIECRVKATSDGGGRSGAAAAAAGAGTGEWKLTHRVPLLLKKQTNTFTIGRPPLDHCTIDGRKAKVFLY